MESRRLRIEQERIDMKKVFKEFERIRLSGKCNMFDLGCVLKIAVDMGCFELLSYLYSEKSDEVKEKYVRILKRYSEWEKGKDKEKRIIRR